ncbi:hypothetical protein C8J56DRAFT_1062689 [Mycena floridula]|nr:hypothetical protein C8J56DRAFT_1062689 [Mycena floridula]
MPELEMAAATSQNLTPEASRECTPLFLKSPHTSLASMFSASPLPQPFKLAPPPPPASLSPIEPEPKSTLRPKTCKRAASHTGAAGGNSPAKKKQRRRKKQSESSTMITHGYPDYCDRCHPYMTGVKQQNPNTKNYLLLDLNECVTERGKTDIAVNQRLIHLMESRVIPPELKNIDRLDPPSPSPPPPPPLLRLCAAHNPCGHGFPCAGFASRGKPPSARSADKVDLQCLSPEAFQQPASQVSVPKIPSSGDYDNSDDIYGDDGDELGLPPDLICDQAVSSSAAAPPLEILADHACSEMQNRFENCSPTLNHDHTCSEKMHSKIALPSQLMVFCLLHLHQIMDYT